MAESKIELTERLRREGRWSEAMAWKDGKIKELRAAGKRKADAADEAWRLLAEKYPPLPPPEPHRKQDGPGDDGSEDEEDEFDALERDIDDYESNPQIDAKLAWLDDHYVICLGDWDDPVLDLLAGVTQVAAKANVLLDQWTEEADGDLQDLIEDAREDGDDSVSEEQIIESHRREIIAVRQAVCDLIHLAVEHRVKQAGQHAVQPSPFLEVESSAGGT